MVKNHPNPYPELYETNLFLLEGINSDILKNTISIQDLAWQINRM
jgi:hypothetical protein